MMKNACAPNCQESESNCINNVMLSIIVPVFNVEKYLERCLESIANQTLKSIEVIIINDGSTDRSLVICEEFGRRHDNFHIYSKINEGQGIARNYGLHLATGEFICYVDSDDWIEPAMCEEVVNVLKTTNADFANYGADFISSNGNVVKSIGNFAVDQLVSRDIFLCALVDKHVLSVAWNKIYRRKLILENHIEFPSIRINEDLFYSRAIAFHATKTVFVSKIYYHALVRDGSTSRTMSAAAFNVSAELIKLETEAFAARLIDKDCQRYFSAHISKFFSYMLIQAAFRIKGYLEYKRCFEIARSVGFYDLCLKKEILRILGVKGAIMVALCHVPWLLRQLAAITKKMRLSSFVY